ncbi:NUDIX hydrolase [Thalassococcus lentus]|uniref:NUDIX hydrolase n=1 Tax=Thalassococcus lentus TaxID=1210524 RepID=A0ABT4XNA3_9RHOB|nr:NUDIX hydrolase [Thalassococcus lentus]MDA7423424.1 NUDIX hydrolase [Thalassococcus lentus]
MIQRIGSPPEPGKRYRVRPGAYAILPQKNALLLTYQDDDQQELQLPGGGIDPGEHPLAALHREVFEETGWRIACPRRLGAFRRYTYMPEYDLWAEKICIIYTARPVRQLGPPTEPDHLALWMPPEVAVAHLGNPGDRAFVARFVLS